MTDINLRINAPVIRLRLSPTLPLGGATDEILAKTAAGDYKAAWIKALKALTGAATLAAGALLYGAGSSQLATLAPGTAGQVLVSGGAGAPSWASTLSLTALTVRTNGSSQRLDVGVASSQQGYLRIMCAGGAREANLYSPAGGGLTIDTNSNAFPVNIQGSALIVGTSDPGGTESIRTTGNIRCGALLCSTTINAGTMLGIGQTSFPSLTSGLGTAYGNATLGLILAGYGSTYDVTIVSRAGAILAGFPTGGGAVFSGAISGISTINATSTVVTAGQYYTGAVGSGTGGAVRFVDDGGTTRWYAGLLGTAGNRDFSIYNLATGSLFQILNSTGYAMFSAGAVFGADPGGGELARFGGTARFADYVMVSAATASLYLDRSTSGNASLIYLRDLTGSRRNWLMGTQYTRDRAWEVTPSTTDGGSTYSEASISADTSNTADDTRFLLWDVTAGSLKRVSRGATDSGGSGFRLLRISN